MDDTWFHSFTTSSAPTTSTQPNRKRGSSLLQQPAEPRVQVIQEPQVPEDIDSGQWTGPPSPSLARRAQSYSDFYDIVTRYGKDQDAGRKLTRKKSLDQLRQIEQEPGSELGFSQDLTAFEDAILHDSHLTYTSYLEQLQLSQASLDNLIVSTNDTLHLLSTLSSSFHAVEAQTGAFREQCESLISEQQRIEHLADALSENAAYYTYLEPITRRLNAPGAANLVKGKDFPELLSNLDNCLEYMDAHTDHKESGVYRSKYRLLLTRALTLIRHYFTNTLMEIAADITDRVQSGDKLKETTHSALLYAKFRVPAPELKALGVEIQKRAKPTLQDVDADREPEYMSLLRELFQTYSAARGRLILPLVSRKFAELATAYQASDLLAFARASFNFMKSITQDEYELWFEWFEPGTETGLYDFLESLMEPMYDYLRPRTIHETQLEKLCEFCSTVQDRYTTPGSDEEEEDGAAILSDVDSTADTSTYDPFNDLATRTRNRPPLDFASLIQPALEDAQTRLVFLALNALREGIENYKPAPAELEWPRQDARDTGNGTNKGPVLSGTRESTRSRNQTPQQDPQLSKDEDILEDFDDSISMLSKQVGLGDKTTVFSTPKQWYPTLRKAIWLLRRIYRLVNSSVFDDLAHRIVHSTTQSILYASSLILKAPAAKDAQHRKDDNDVQDPLGRRTTALLFTIAHLLQLKQQIVNFDIETTTLRPEVEFDFSSVTNTFYELRDRGSLWNPAGWVRLVGGAVVGGGLIPRVVENMLDAKSELDAVLRGQINDLVTAYASHITEPIDGANGLLVAGKEGTPISDNASTETALKAARTVRGLAEKNAPRLRAKLERAFPTDASSNGNAASIRTRETLIAAVRDQVSLSYEDFFDTYVQREGARVSKKGKGREGELWGPDVFAEGMTRVFASGTGRVPDENGD